ncbi:TPA: hypothetical protein JD050_10965 [Proteus mirabilis]|nr:hypothetical protein [Proteus mirabilis]
MSTYLYNWGSWKGWDNETFNNVLKNIADIGFHDEEWTTTRTKINVGDKILLIRSKQKSKNGLIGCGYVIRGVHKGKKHDNDKIGNKITIRFTTLFKSAVISAESLKEYDNTQCWVGQTAGMIVKNSHVADELFNVLTSLSNSELSLDSILNIKNKDQLKIKNKLEQIKDPIRLGIAKFRLGQQKFRNILLKKWKKRCVITNLDIENLLVASHIKPWALSSPSEKLDKYNGLLLSAHLDILFDKGFISFDNNGFILISPSIKNEKEALGINDNMKFKIEKDHIKYLEFHRQNIFKKESPHLILKSNKII